MIPILYRLIYCALIQIKEAAVRLARLYMRRVSGELDQIVAGSEKGPLREFLLLQGVRFAFRVHQVRRFNWVLNNTVLHSLLGSYERSWHFFMTGLLISDVSTQFSGGFDAESMAAFDALRNRAQT